MARRKDREGWERIYREVDESVETYNTTEPGQFAEDRMGGVDWPTFEEGTKGIARLWSSFFPPPPRGGDTTIIEASNPLEGLMPMLPWIAGGGVALYLLTRKKS